MFRILTLASLLLASAFSFGQTANIADAMGKKSDEIVTAIRKLQIMNQLLPLTMERQQIQKILPSIEKVRQKVRETYKAEHQKLLEFEKDTLAALEEASKNKKMPSKDLMDKIGKFFVASDLVRTQVAQENINNVVEAMKANLNKGQIKAAANSLTLSFYEPDVKPENADEEFRLRVFVREVMLDPLTYELLLAMSR